MILESTFLINDNKIVVTIVLRPLATCPFWKSRPKNCFGEYMPKSRTCGGFCFKVLPELFAGDSVFGATSRYVLSFQKERC